MLGLVYIVHYEYSSSVSESANPKMAQFIQSINKKRKVVDESNYIYDFHSSNIKLVKEYWRCEAAVFSADSYGNGKQCTKNYLFFQ